MGAFRSAIAMFIPLATRFELLVVPMNRAESYAGADDADRVWHRHTILGGSSDHWHGYGSARARWHGHPE